MNGRKEHTERTANSRSLHKVSISRIKKEMHDVSYLSDDMVITSLDAQNNTTSAYSVTIDGFAVIIMMQGEATVSIDMETYVVRPNMVVFFNPDSVIRTVKSSPDAMAYCLAFSKSFVNEIQIDISTSLPIYMRFGKDPVLKVTEQDVSEIRQLFRLVKTMLQSDKERYRHEIIRTLFTAVFYIITEINLREQKGERKQGRCEVIFEEFMNLLEQYNKRERNVGFYARQLGITPKYLSSVVKEVSGKTAARWIDESVILEAKTLLKYSGLSIQEIAYELNFSTQSFFGKYFKQHTGTSPSRYKRRGLGACGPPLLSRGWALRPDAAYASRRVLYSCRAVLCRAVPCRAAGECGCGADATENPRSLLAPGVCHCGCPCGARRRDAGGITSSSVRRLRGSCPRRCP